MTWKLTGNDNVDVTIKDHFLGTSNNEPLVIKTGNEPRVRITAAGGVGIGTAAPQATLDVNGGLRVSDEVHVGGEARFNTVRIGDFGPLSGLHIDPDIFDTPILVGGPFVRVDWR